MLSNVDIIKELGRNILISPLNLEKIKGSTIDLSASKFAWSVRTQKSIYDPNTGKIIIPASDTALIETAECLAVSDRIGGTYHSIVGLVSRGIGHISTTLDPGWIGSSLMAMHNTTNKDIDILTGQRIVSVALSYLDTKATGHESNLGGRPELLNGYQLDDECRQWLDRESQRNWDRLKDEMTDSEEFQNLLARRKKRFHWLRGRVAVNLFVLVICVAIHFLCSALKRRFGLNVEKSLLPLLAVYLAVTASQLTGRK